MLPAISLRHSFITLLSVLGATASPLLEPRASATALSTAQISAYAPYINLAGAAYCSLGGSWSCGSFCTAVPGFQVTASGGDGDDQPRWYVGYWSQTGEIIVSFQGTNGTNAAAILNNLNFAQSSLPQDLFPGAPSNAVAHNGFLKVHRYSATSILTAVKALVQSKGATKVTTVGHSLGAATATLTGISLSLNLPSTITFRTTGLASPRVGNSAFANLVDTKISNLAHISNKKDPVPILPPIIFNYSHSNGEVHITEDTGAWYSCPGHDSTETHCTRDDVPNILVSDANDHSGPYGGVMMGPTGC
ncbi:lipase class 3 family protein [Serendipita vermifera]|nr:lipase class 3 family protein [Serendipita vermifera]